MLPIYSLLKSTAPALQKTNYQSFYSSILRPVLPVVAVPRSTRHVLGLMTRSLTHSSATGLKHTTHPADFDPDDRCAMNTERSEYAISGTDNAVAAQRTPWDISYHDPEDARIASNLESEQHGGRRTGGPLEVSPANQDVSKFTDESGRYESMTKGPSKRVSPFKRKKVDASGIVVGTGHESKLPGLSPHEVSKT
ncbi:hypothetical protein FQN57_000494 [Myotisia sp. PD_48]|nr:hypothetical protein FQN57_000494 [Myotisia sp. PD_48]